MGSYFGIWCRMFVVIVKGPGSKGLVIRADVSQACLSTVSGAIGRKSAEHAVENRGPITISFRACFKEVLDTIVSLSRS